MNDPLARAILGTVVLIGGVVAVVLLAKWGTIDAQGTTAILGAAVGAGGQALVREVRSNGSG